MIKILLCVMGPVVACAGESDPAASLRRLHDARRAFMSGYYRHAHDTFSALRDTADHDVAQAAVIAQADCEMTWGDYARALETLTSAPSGGSADWHRAIAAAHRRLGQYDQAVEHGRQSIAIDKAYTRGRYELGQTYELLGKRDKALETYTWFNDLLTSRFPETAVDAHYAGQGFYRYSVLAQVPNLTERTKYVLQEVLQKSCMVMDLTYWPGRLAVADLLAEKYSEEEATQDYMAVLRENPNCLEAHLGLAAIALASWEFERVEQRISVCLEINPRSAESYVLLAALRMLERRFEEARHACRLALEINPNHVEALSYLAAAQLRLGRDADADKARKRVYEINARPSVMHLILGSQFAQARQFPESEEELLEAIELDPTAVTPRNELAMMYMQWGYEDNAGQVLSKALDMDSFNTRTYNTEALLLDLAAFERYKTEHFEVHYDPKHDAVLGPYAGQYLERIYDELLEDYETELETTTIIEFFPDHRKFGVRIHGKPWIHTVGACTGRVIAMDAPREALMGAYHYANVLRHEFTHTVTLAATNNRIPHWMTEGLAVLQEDHPKSWNWRQGLVSRLIEDQLFAIAEIDWGFVRPRRPDDRQIAYAQSEWMCEYLIERFGYGVINDMLRRFRTGQVQKEIISAITGQSEAGFDKAFRTWALGRAQSWGLPLDEPPDARVTRVLLELYPQNPDLLADRGELLLEENDPEGTLQEAQKALDKNPKHLAALKAAMHAHLRQAAHAPSENLYKQHLESAKATSLKIVAVEPEEPEALEFLAEWGYRHEAPDEAIEYARRLQIRQPFNPASYRVLSGVFLEGDDDDQALPQLLELARHQKQDADVPRQIARIYRERGKLRAAAYWYHESLYIDPYDVPTHRTYAELLGDLQDHDGMIREYRMLTLLEPEKASHYSELAFAYHQAGRRDEARSVAQKAVELDPLCPARQLLQK